MCGIAGLFNTGHTFGDAAGTLAVVRTMTNSMVHRGPDASGTWADPESHCFLGHRRLSIIDTSDAGRQPMTSVDGAWVISFNGEIYNFLELRPLLEAKGVSFHGRTDTEVLLASLAIWGLDGLKRLDGMFAFAAFNRKSGEMILARDPFGEKPLYYSELPGGGLAFASELQALELLPGFDGEASVDAMAEVLMFQYIGAPRTIYKQVKKLPAGCWLVARAGQAPQIGRYFEFHPGEHDFDSRPIGDLADELEEILVRSIRRRLISDVPLGAFLSGGVDSSTVCALIRRKLDVPLKTFSIGFRDAPESEHEAASAFARHLGTEHYDRILAPDANEFLTGIGRVLDEPNADSSCLPTYLLSQFARERVTVAVSGDGGDEMFAGYGRYFQTLDEEHAAMRRTTWRPGKSYYSERILVSTERHIEELFGSVPDGLRRHLARLREEIDRPGAPLNCRLRKSDVDNYLPGAVLPKVDRMSMQHSLEVRTPFLNVELARFAERLPQSVLYKGGRGKLLLRELAYRYLPRDLIDLPKQGFGIPMSQWAQQELLGVAEKLLNGEDSRLRQSLGHAAMDKFLARQNSSNGFSTYQVWSIVMLESWVRHHPARLPDLGETARQASTQRRSQPIEPRLCAIPLGAGLFVAQVLTYGSTGTDGGPSALPQEEIDGLADRVAEIVHGLGLPEISGQNDDDTALQPDSLPLSLASEPLDPRFKGGNLVLLEISQVSYLDTNLLHLLRRSGLQSVIFPHPHRAAGNWVRIRLNGSEGVWRDLLNMHRLRRMRVGSWRLFSASHIRGHRYEVGPIESLPGENDVEFSHRFALFEGNRQLAPVPVPHDEIVNLGGGRYSIWSRHCVFSPYDGASLVGRRYWLVPQNQATERKLPFVSEFLKENDFDVNIFLAKLAARVSSRRAAPPAKIGPGDHVVLLTHALWPGGAERQWCYLAAGLRRLSYEVTFVVVEPLEGERAHYLPYLKERGIRVLEVDSVPISKALTFRDPAQTTETSLMGANDNPFGYRLVRLAWLLNTLKPKVVFSQLDYPNLLAGIASLAANVPRVVFSFRNYNPSNFSYLHNEWLQPTYRLLTRCESVTLSGNSHVANDDYANWMGVPKESIAWIPNGIDTRIFITADTTTIDAIRKEFGINLEEPTILGVFRLSEEKRPLLFLEVCALIRQRIPALRVLVAGVGPLLDAIKLRARDLGLSDAITMLGNRRDIPALMGAADILLLTSSFEGMPNVVIEAQAVGLPVVAARVGGLPDCVLEGKTGILVDSSDPAALASACAELLLDRHRRDKMGRAAAEWAGAQFSKEQMVQRHINLVNECPDRSVGPGDSRSTALQISD